MYRTLFFVGLILAVAFLIATIVLFFVLKIPKALGVITGRTQKRAIEEIRAGGREAVSKRSKSRSRNIHVREVEMDTGALHRSNTDSGLKDAAGAAMKDAAGAAAKEAVNAAAENTSKATTGGRSRKDKSKAFEETEILDFTGNLENGEITPESESDTEVLGAGSAAEDETDLLSSSDGGNGAATMGATIGATMRKPDTSEYTEEETDVLSSGPRPEEDDGGETDVLISGSGVPEDEEIVGRYSAEETAVLRSIHSTVEEEKSDGRKIVVLYSETIVHTEEKL